MPLLEFPLHSIDEGPSALAKVTCQRFQLLKTGDDERLLATRHLRTITQFPRCLPGRIRILLSLRGPHE